MLVYTYRDFPDIAYQFSGSCTQMTGGELSASLHRGAMDIHMSSVSCDELTVLSCLSTIFSLRGNNPILDFPIKTSSPIRISIQEQVIS